MNKKLVFLVCAFFIGASATLIGSSCPSCQCANSCCSCCGSRPGTCSFEHKRVQLLEQARYERNLICPDWLDYRFCTQTKADLAAAEIARKIGVLNARLVTIRQIRDRGWLRDVCDARIRVLCSTLGTARAEYNEQCRCYAHLSVRDKFDADALYITAYRLGLAEGERFALEDTNRAELSVDACSQFNVLSQQVERDVQVANPCFDQEFYMTCSQKTADEQAVQIAHRAGYLVGRVHRLELLAQTAQLSDRDSRSIKKAETAGALGEYDKAKSAYYRMSVPDKPAIDTFFRAAYALGFVEGELSAIKDLQ